MNALEVIEHFSQLRVAVVGDAMLDIYLAGSSGRICREAPVPVVSLNTRRATPGGGANTARNIAALGASVQFISLIGHDPAGDELHMLLTQGGVDMSRVVRQADRATITKHRVAADAQLLLRFDAGVEAPIDAQAEAVLCTHLAAAYAWADAIIISDYGLGVITPGVLSRLQALQSRQPRLLIADARRLEPYCGIGLTAVKPNYDEACRLLGLPTMTEARAEQMREHGTGIIARTGAQIAAITLDVEGAVVFERDGPPYRTYGRRVPPAQAAGAGDTFVSALTLALAAGAHTTLGADIAAAAAAVAVEKPGTADCDACELRAVFAGGNKTLNAEVVRERVMQWREQGMRIVFTNGCFDILHRGHVTYLSRAKSLGDILVVGINSDESVRRLKGASRPINPLDDRTQVLAALSCVDYVVSFEDNTAAGLIELIRPDIYVKGSDHARDGLPEVPLVEAYGGRVVLLEYLADYSTTRVVEKIAAERTGIAGQTEVSSHGEQRLEPGAQSAMRQA